MDHAPMPRERLVADARPLEPVPGGPRSGSSKLGGLVPRGSVASVKCQATNRAGRQCGKWAVVGSTVCATHGAAQGTAARRAAEARLLDLRPQAIEVLKRAMAGGTEADPVPWSQQVRAAAIVLDHVEPKVAQRHEHTHEVTELGQALDARIAEALAARGHQVPELQDITDAEVLSDEAH